MIGLALDSPVVQDLLEALQDDEMTDVTLEGCDGIPIPASRFVLAARSSVLKRMLYGNFREANDSRITLEDYDSVILEAVVEYCYRNEISKFRLYVHRTASSARRLVQLYKAADYLALLGLAKLVAQMAHNLTTRYPPLACAVYDEADLCTKVSRDALEMIQSRPYVTLPPDPNTEGGIGCLSSRHKLISVYHDQNVQAGELFLFQMLQEWKACRMEEDEDNGGRRRCPSNNRGAHDTERGAAAAAAEDHSWTTTTVQECATHLVLDNIEPHELLTIVSPSGFCQPDSITQAITKQALRASQTRVWTMGSRGPAIERILVEGAGTKDANGIYYRIDGLANGELYSKREISCGQEYVYTLSISLKSTSTAAAAVNSGNSSSSNQQEHVECRIFCSKILTHKAIARLAKRSSSGGGSVEVGHLFQPILQVLALEYVPSQEQVSSARVGKHQMQLSDGDHFLYAIMSPRLRSASKTKELSQNTLIKVTNYEKCIAASSQEVPGVEKGQMYIHIRKLSIISQDPGHKFCNPVHYYNVCDDDESEEELSTFSSSSSLDGIPEEAVIVNPHASISMLRENTLDSFMGPNATTAPPPRRLFVAESQALQELYFCKYQICDKPIDSKVPATEWEVDVQGVGPGPKCRWIPAATAAAPVDSPTIGGGSGNKHTKTGNVTDDASSNDSRIATTSVDVKRPAVASFNAFAASVLPLPLQKKYSLAPYDTT